jgi:hypothetical protein
MSWPSLYALSGECVRATDCPEGQYRPDDRRQADGRKIAPSRLCPVASIRPDGAVLDDWGALQQPNITSDW